jgi:iron-sulfur cluster assembly protein
VEHGLTITVTPHAAAQIARAAEQAGGASACLRLAARLDAKGVIEYGMGFDDKAEDDAQVVSNGVTLLVSPGSVELLTGATLDYVEINPGEWRFIFINPNDPSHKPPKPGG